MTRTELTKLYKKTYKQITRLYNGYTPVREIQELYRLLEIAYQNESKKIVNNL